MNRCHGLVLTAAVTVVGCAAQPEQPDVERFREGIPSADEVKLQEPLASGDTQQPQSFSTQLSPQDLGSGSPYATYYRFTRELFDGVNWGTAYILGSVWIIVHYPPTTLSEDEAIWGPWSEALSPAEWQFRATEVADGEFAYVLEGRAKNSTETFREAWTGRGYAKNHPNHRQGWFDIDFDAANELDPARLRADDDTGAVKVSYDISKFPTVITADRTNDDGGLWFTVQVTTQQSGGGRVDITAMDDVDESDATLQEKVVMRSRWKGTGAGRADVTVSEGDLPTGLTIQASECWGEDFSRSYYVDSMAIEPEQGDLATCAFADPEY